MSWRNTVEKHIALKKQHAENAVTCFHLVTYPKHTMKHTLLVHSRVSKKKTTPKTDQNFIAFSSFSKALQKA